MSATRRSLQTRTPKQTPSSPRSREHLGRGCSERLARPAARLVAGCGGTKTATRTVTVDATAKQGVGAPGETVLFGHLKSLTSKGLELRAPVRPGALPQRRDGERCGGRGRRGRLRASRSPTTTTSSTRAIGCSPTWFRRRQSDGADGDPESTPITVAELAQIVAGDQSRSGSRSTPASGCAPGSTPSARSTSSTGPMVRGLRPAVGSAACRASFGSLPGSSRSVYFWRLIAARVTKFRFRWRSIARGRSGPARRRPPRAAR